MFLIVNDTQMELIFATIRDIKDVVPFYHLRNHIYKHEFQHFLKQ